MRTKGIRYTIKDGIVYPVDELLRDARVLVEQAKQAAANTSKKG